MCCYLRLFIGFIIEGLCEFSTRTFRSLSHFRYAVGGMRVFHESFEFCEILLFLGSKLLYFIGMRVE